MLETTPGLAEAYRDRAAAARAWKAAGGQVVGYFCDNFPVELVAAAGFLPVRVTGDPDYDREAERKYIGALLPKTFSSVRQSGLEFVNTVAVGLISGAYRELDYLVISATRKTILNIYPQLLAAKGAYPEVELPEIVFLDHAHAPVESARAFNRRAMLGFKAQLEAWAGAPIGEAALREAVAEANEGRALVRRLNALRTSDPPRLSGAAFLEAVGGGKFMCRADHNRLLEAFLDGYAGAPRPGLRVFVGGSPADNLALYSAIEAEGATAVAEDHCWGERCADLEIAEDASPLEGLIARWREAPPCGLRFPIDASPANCVARAKAARADCAILYVHRGDDLQMWDTPQEIAALEAASVPTLYLQEQPYKVDGPAVREAVSRFFAGVRARAGAPT